MEENKEMQQEIKRKKMNERKIREIDMGWGWRGERPSPAPQASKSSLTRHLRCAYALLTQKNHQNIDDKI